MSAPGRPKREYRSAKRAGDSSSAPGRAKREGTPARASGRRVGVIGTGAMGGGVVQSLVRAGVTTSARDIRAEAQALAVRHGAAATASPADLARTCEVIVLLVVDAAQIETVLFGTDGVATAGPTNRIVLVSSTVDPAYVAALAPRLAAHDIALLDAPVSGGPAKAAAGTMTMMVSGDAEAFAQVRAMLEQITGRLFALSTRPGDASTFKIVNNLLAAANLAAGAEALALARAAGLDLRQVFDVVAASSGGSWMFGDRVPRALVGDYAPRAAAKLLDKDSGIAAALADRLHVDAPFTHLAHRAFAAAVVEGCGDEDDAVLIRRALESVQPPER
jgi:3-hydroxyisobutyrate dehydrogenase-like beta-hydroxyacid dehydrogenase